MWNKQKVWWITLGCLITCNVLLFLSFTPAKAKLGYIELSKVFNEFNMTREIKQKYEAENNQMKSKLDSLGMILRQEEMLIEQTENPEKDKVLSFLSRRDQYEELLRDFEMSTAEKSQQYDAQILEQMNQYVYEFGKENGFAYIFGNSGNGSLMYAAEGDNVTTEVILFINDKYQGRK